MGLQYYHATSILFRMNQLNSPNSNASFQAVKARKVLEVSLVPST